MIEKEGKLDQAGLIQESCMYEQPEGKIIEVMILRQEEKNKICGNVYNEIEREGIQTMKNTLIRTGRERSLSVRNN